MEEDEGIGFAYPTLKEGGMMRETVSCPFLRRDTVRPDDPIFVILSKKMEQKKKYLNFLWDSAKNFCKNLRKFHFAQELSCCQARRNIV